MADIFRPRTATLIALLAIFPAVFMATPTAPMTEPMKETVNPIMLARVPTVTPEVATSMLLAFEG